MDKYKVDKGVELTDSKLPIKEMDVDDSFFIPFKDSRAKSCHSLQASTMSRIRFLILRDNLLIKFTSKIRVEEEVEGIRIWRIK